MKFKSDLDLLVDQMIEDAKKALGVEEKTILMANQETITFSEMLFRKASKDVFEAAEKPASAGESKVATQKESDALIAKVLSTTKDLNPLYIFKKRLTQVIADFGKTDGEEKDVAAFKRAFNLAQAECVNRYKAEGNSTAVDYLKAAGLMLLGALVAIIASPVLLFSADKRQDLGNFFFPQPIVATDRSKLAQEQMKADAADSLLEEVTPTA